MSILKTAQTVRSLRNTQRAMATSGDHRSAWQVGPDVREAMYTLANQYIGRSVTLRDNPVTQLVVEIACEAALAAPDIPHTHELKVLLRKANRMSRHQEHAQQWYRRLRAAKRQLPDIDNVIRHLSPSNIK